MEEVIETLRNNTEGNENLPCLDDCVLLERSSDPFSGVDPRENPAVVVKKSDAIVNGHKINLRRVFVRFRHAPDYRFIGWVAASDIDNCMICAAQFSFFTWKYHCHVCGDVVCDSCSRGTVKIKEFREYGYVRACNHCYFGQDELSIKVKLPERVVLKNAPSTCEKQELRSTGASKEKPGKNLSVQESNIDAVIITENLVRAEAEEIARLELEVDSRREAATSTQNAEKLESLQKDGEEDASSRKHAEANVEAMLGIASNSVDTSSEIDTETETASDHRIGTETESAGVILETKAEVGVSAENIVLETKVEVGESAENKPTVRIDTASEGLGPDTTSDAIKCIDGVPFNVIKTKNSDGGKVFINMCTHESIPVGKMVTGNNSPHEILDKSGDTCVGYDICVSPEYLTNESLSHEVYHQAIEYLKSTTSLQLDEVFKLPKIKGNFKGNHTPRFTLTPDHSNDS